MSAKITPGRKTTRPRGYIENYRPQPKTRMLLEAVARVLEEYRDYWPLTCQQVYYRLIGARGYPKTETFKATLCHHVANARRGRLIPFEAIRDDGVVTVHLGHYEDAHAFLWDIRSKARNYRRDLLAHQKRHIEVWCEAAGMIPQLARVAEDYSIRVYSSSGFDTVTAKKELADRICEIGKPTVILHLGDFDPSGESIFTVIEEDVRAFVMTDRLHGFASVEFRRVALSAKQVKEYRLPTAPPKATDSRSKTWAGETCQLEALAPDQIAALLRDAIEQVIDFDVFDEDLAQEGEERTRLTRLLLTGPGAGGGGD